LAAHTADTPLAHEGCSGFVRTRLALTVMSKTVKTAYEKVLNRGGSRCSVFDERTKASGVERLTAIYSDVIAAALFMLKNLHGAA
jgi:hypothetical protein